LVSAVEDPCSVRTDDVPCLHIVACDPLDAGGGTAFGDFKVSDAKDDVPAVQGTSGTICWDADGLHVDEVASDKYIFSPYTTCDSEVFESSDVVEVQ